MSPGEATAFSRKAQAVEIRQRYAGPGARQREVIALAVPGMLNKQVAAELGPVKPPPKFTSRT